MIWNLAQVMGVPEMAKMLHLAVTYFDPAADYKNFVEALMMADKSMYGGGHACQIFEEAVKDGFTPYLGTLSCQPYAPVAAH